VCTAAFLDELSDYAPVLAVLGNNDGRRRKGRLIAVMRQVALTGLDGAAGVVAKHLTRHVMPGWVTAGPTDRQMRYAPRRPLARHRRRGLDSRLAILKDVTERACNAYAGGPSSPLMTAELPGISRPLGQSPHVIV
jgi:hypothetical protein